MIASPDTPNLESALPYSELRLALLANTLSYNLELLDVLYLLAFARNTKLSKTLCCALLSTICAAVALASCLPTTTLAAVHVDIAVVWRHLPRPWEPFKTSRNSSGRPYLTIGCDMIVCVAFLAFSWPFAFATVLAFAVASLLQTVLVENSKGFVARVTLPTFRRSSRSPPRSP